MEGPWSLRTMGINLVASCIQRIILIHGCDLWVGRQEVEPLEKDKKWNHMKTCRRGPRHILWRYPLAWAQVWRNEFYRCISSGRRKWWLMLHNPVNPSRAPLSDFGLSLGKGHASTNDLQFSHNIWFEVKIQSNQTVCEAAPRQYWNR